MKKRFVALIYLGAIILIFGGLLLTVYTRNGIYMSITFGIFFFISILSIPLYIFRMNKEYKRQEKMSSDDVIKEINEDTGYNQLEHNVQQIKAVVDTWNLSSKADKIKGFLFLGFFLGCIIAFVVCMSCHQIILGIIFFCLGVGEILIAFFVVKFLETRSIHPRKTRKFRKEVAIILGVTLSSQSSTGKRHHHILNTTYKVFLKIGNEKITTYSKEFYETGDKVRVQVDIKNPKRVHIIEKIEDIFELEENY